MGDVTFVVSTKNARERADLKKKPFPKLFRN